LTIANLAILDTSVYIDNLRSGRFKQEILDLKFVVRCSAVVLAELSRGARSREMRRFVDGLAKNLRIIAPTEREWIASGEIIRYLIAEHRYDVNKTREVHFDVLIALTARRSGAYLITCNSKDFTAIQRYVGFELICW
jgi:predicted nucleic acid-binding protein